MRAVLRKLNQGCLLALCLLMGTVLLACSEGEKTAAEPPKPAVERGETAELRFSEVCASSNKGVQCVCGNYCDWVELYNGGKEDFSLDGWHLSDDAEKAGASLSGFFVPAEGYVLLPCCTCGSSKSVKLGISKGGERLILTNGERTLTLEMPALNKNESYAADEAGRWGYCIAPTPGKANTTALREKRQWAEASMAGVHISEIDPKGGWIELYNPTQEAVSLEGLYLSDDGEDLCAFALRGTMEPGAYALIYEEDGGIRFGQGDRVYLTNAADGTRDETEIPEALEAGASLGRDEEGVLVRYRHPTPGKANGKGYAFEEALPWFESSGLYISEVSAAADPKGLGGDWVELYNGSEREIDLTGWHLTDKLEEPKRWALRGTVKAGEYLLVKEESFSLSASGETLYLYDEEGTLIDCFTFAALEPGVTCGRLGEDPFTERVLYDRPTPGKANSQSRYTGYAPTPILSETGLYHKAAFPLTAKAAGEEAVLRYTTDGSVPTEKSALYTGEVVIDRSMSFCIRAFEAGKLPSRPVYGQYLFEEPHTVPVVCLSADPKEFSALYNVKEKEQVTEKGGYFSFYEKDGSLGTAFPCGIKAKGRGSLSFPQKSLTIKLRGKYGQKSAGYPFFGEEGLSYYSLCLRSGGQDIDGAIIRDSLISRAAEGLHVDAQASRPVAVYVNGEYYGLYALNEEMNADYFVTHYGAVKEAMEVISQSHTEKSGSAEAFLALRKEAVKAKGKGEAFEAFCAQVDVEAFTEYAVIQTLTGNSDTMNQKYARSADGKVSWRPILFDLDFAYAYPNMNTMGQYFKDDGFRPREDSTLRIQNDIYKGLYANESWRAAFAEKFVELAYGAFDTERMLALVDEMAAEIRPEMERQIARWGMHASIEDWEAEIQKLKTIIAYRRETALGQMQKTFGLTDEALRELIKKYGSK